MSLDLLIEILGTLVGLLYLYWEYRADRRLWIAGIIMPALSLFVYWRAGLYADFGINVYYLLAAVYGWWAWRISQPPSIPPNGGRLDGIQDVNSCNNTNSTPSPRSGGDGGGLGVSSFPLRLLPCLTLTFLLAFLAIGLLLERVTDSTVPWWDSFTTALSIVGLWMLSRKWVEQWIPWIVVDAVSAGLYIYKEVYFYAALYALYTVVAVFGYREWKRKATPPQPSPTGEGD